MTIVELLALIFGISTAVLMVVTLLQNRIARFGEEIKTVKSEMQALRSEMHANLQEMESRINSRIDQVENRINRLENLMEQILIVMIGKSKILPKEQKAKNIT